MNEVFSHAESNGISTRCSYQKLKLPHRKTSQGLRALSYIPHCGINIFLNAFIHNLKDY